MPSRRLLLALGLVLAAPLGCSAAGGEEEVDTTHDELRALQAAEKVGDIAFGEAKDVAYTRSPTYRALHVAARANDTIDAWVRGDGASDALAWVVNARSTTLASNDDAAGHDAHVTYRVRTAGDYWIVLRDKDSLAATLHVTLAARDAGGGGGGEADCGVGKASKCAPGKKCKVDADCTVACGYPPATLKGLRASTHPQARMDPGRAGRASERYLAT